MVEYLAVAFRRNELTEMTFGALYFYEEEGKIDFQIMNKFHKREKEDMLTILYKGK